MWRAQKRELQGDKSWWKGCRQDVRAHRPPRPRQGCVLGGCPPRVCRLPRTNAVSMALATVAPACVARAQALPVFSLSSSNCPEDFILSRYDRFHR